MAAHSTVVTLPILAILAACAAGSSSPQGTDENPRAEGGPLIRTDQSVYTARRDTTYLADGTVHGRYVQLSIGLRYTNSTGGPIYIPTCHSVSPPTLQKKEGGEWVTAYAPIVQLCLGPPEIIQPGKTFEYTYQVEGFLPGSRVMPQFETTVPGTYRLVWTAYATWTPSGAEPGLGRELPLADRVSNEFEIVE